MECICKFDKARDKGETTQFGAVDLNDLLGKGVLPADLNVVDTDFNDIQDPKAIYGRPRDQFEAMTLAKELNKRGAEAQRLADERKAALEAAQK